jgi:hypothetical protein
MHAQTESSADKRTALFMTMVHVGAAATVLLLATLVFDLPDFIDGLPLGILLISIGVILRRKLRDEYIEGLWSAGTTFAFTAVLLAFLLAPAVAGLAGRAISSDGDSPLVLVAVQWPAAVALAAFYVGFYWRMATGGVAP